MNYKHSFTGETTARNQLVLDRPDFSYLITAPDTCKPLMFIELINNSQSAAA